MAGHFAPGLRTTALIAGAVSANSVQAAPVGLAVTVTAAAAAKGAAVGSSTLLLVKGALKLMAWIKAKTAIVGAAVIVATGVTTVVVTNALMGSSNLRAQPLVEGSMLVLNRVSFGSTNEFIHGNGLEKVLKKVIPAKGLQLIGLKLTRPTLQKFEAAPGKTQLVAEFKIIGSNLVSHPLVKPALYPEFRSMIRGERGIEFAYEFWRGNFQTYSDGYFGYVIASRFPRDSRWLWFRIERRESSDKGGPWKSVAEFKIKNTVRSIVQPWVAEPVHVTKTVAGMDFILDEITVVTQSYSPRAIWNHIVTTPFQVESNGAVLTNWGAAYVRVEDASGNFEYGLGHRALDPRFVWKLEADFEPESDFPPESVATVDLSGRSSPITTNILDVPVKISWDGSYWIDVNMPTNRPDLALKFVCVTDEHGNKAVDASGSWGRHQFRKGSFMFRNGNVLTMVGTPTTLTFAAVPNVHATFCVQPRLADEHVK